jgi:hypothetical protein
VRDAAINGCLNTYGVARHVIYTHTFVVPCLPIDSYQFTVVYAEICLTVTKRSDTVVRDRCEAPTLWGEQPRVMLGQLLYTVHPNTVSNF